MAGAATVLLTYGDSIVAGCLTDFKNITTYTSVPLPAQPGMLILLYLSASSGLTIGPGCTLWISALIGDHHGYKERVPRTGTQSLGVPSRPLRPACYQADPGLGRMESLR